MKVVKKGRSQKGWAKKFKCTGSGNGMGGCGATLLVEQPDVFLTHHHLYDGTHDVFQTFKCIECGVLTDIKEILPFTPPDQKQWKKINGVNEKKDR